MAATAPVRLYPERTAPAAPAAGRLRMLERLLQRLSFQPAARAAALSRPALLRGARAVWRPF